MKKTGSIYYNTDKNISDALHNIKFGRKLLINQLKDRNILVSHKEEKQDLIEYCSSIFTDYHNQNFIHEVLDETKPRNNYQSRKVKANIETDELRGLCDKIVSERESLGESTKVHISPDSKIITIQTSYTEPDYSKSVMSQNLTRTSNIRIEHDDEGVNIRGYSDDKSISMSSELIDLIRKDSEDDENKEEAEEFIISLETISDPVARSEFFHNLINNIEGYTIDDVKSVYVNHPKKLDEEEDSEEVIGFIKKAVLNGGSVLNSPEFKSLNESSFYVTKIKWSAISDALNGDKIDLSAEFRSTETCSDFVYSVVSIYKRKTDGLFTKNGKSPSELEKSILLPLIEKSATDSYHSIINKYGDHSDTGLDESHE